MTIGPILLSRPSPVGLLFAFLLLVVATSRQNVAQIDSGSFIVRGAHLIDSAFLRDSVASLPPERTVESLRTWYGRHGWFDVFVTRDSGIVAVDEGKRYRIDAIPVILQTVPGDSQPGDSQPGDSQPGDSQPGDSQPGDSQRIRDDLSERASVGLPVFYTDTLLVARRTALLSHLSTLGFPFASATIEIERLDSAAALVTPRITIDLGEYIVIDTLLFAGADRTSSSFLIDRLPDLIGSGFDESRLSDIRSQLVGLNLFDRVDLPQLVRVDSHRYGLRIDVVERSANTFDGVIAYQPSTGLGVGGYFTGLVRIVLRNLFGSAEWISGRWEKTTRTSSILELGFRQPYLFGLPLGIEVAFSQLQEEETPTVVSWVDRRIEATLLWQLSSRWRLEIGGNYLGLLPAPDTGTNPCSPRSIRNSATLGVRAGVVFDTRDNPANPMSGALYKAGYRLGRKSSDALNGCDDGAGGEATVSRGFAEIGIEGYLPISGVIVMMARGSAIDIGGDDVEITELFRLGGLRTIRGYREGAFRVGRGAWGGVEGRVILSERSHVGPFFDLGYYVTPADTLHAVTRVEDLLFGYGIAMQIDTPLGLSQLSVGLGKGDPIEQAKVSIGLAGEF